MPYTYFPDPVGGTEIYVAGLVRALRACGIPGSVAAPAAAEAAYDHDGVPVFRFATAGGGGLAQAYGAPDPAAAQSFARLLRQLRPGIVHLHARTAAVSGQLVDAAREIGAPVVLTYHTPTVSCARGTMMRLGRAPCDGRLDRLRCTACTLAAHGVPPGLRALVARTPVAVGRALGLAGLAGGALTALRLSCLIGAAHRRFTALMQAADRIVAPCDWVRDVLRANGVPEEKLVLCRQGLAPQPASPEKRRAGSARDMASGVLRLAYFGRLDPAKGVDIVVEALRRAPRVAARLDIYGIRQPGCEPYVEQIERAAAADRRVALWPALPSEAVGEAMRRCDLVVIPSRWLETGPLVVLEAFAAGTPVLGARRGGIAELVADGHDGELVAPDDVAAWAAAISALVAAPQRLARLRAHVRPPRTMENVAHEMSDLYRGLLADA